MIRAKTLRFISPLVLSTFVASACYLPVAQAAMIPTEQTLPAASGTDRARVEAMLARADMAEQLQAAGVDPAQLQARLASLSDTEVAAINGRLDQLPAGGDILGTAVFIFLILLATDILGYTDVFPFVKKTVK